MRIPSGDNVLRTLLILLTLSVASTDADAQRARRCGGDPPDSTVTAVSPVWRDCEVDRAARLKGVEPRLALGQVSPGQIREGCYYAEFVFVVDTLGEVELATVKLRRNDQRELTEAARESIQTLRYEPAMKDSVLVRQQVLYRRSMAVAGARPVGRFNPPLPRCA